MTSGFSWRHLETLLDQDSNRKQWQGNAPVSSASRGRFSAPPPPTISQRRLSDVVVHSPMLQTLIAHTQELRLPRGSTPHLSPPHPIPLNVRYDSRTAGCWAMPTELPASTLYRSHSMIMTPAILKHSVNCLRGLRTTIATFVLCLCENLPCR